MGVTIILGGLVFHIFLLLSIFDIYFHSPIVQNVQPFQPLHTPLARRVILVVVDGMRAEAFLEHERTPFLRSIARTKGLWGIANTHVPTESRTAQVAIIAGFYEDSSAVTMSLKRTPIYFDSVFNESRYTWCFGSDDIVHIFSMKNDGHIFKSSYNANEQGNLNTEKNTTVIDGWVFDRLTSVFEIAKNDTDLTSKLRDDKLVFFLYLPGVDLSGHIHKPNNWKFVASMRYVDYQIHDLVKLIEEFYEHDGQTAYVIISDHGMTDYGSYGSGSRNETEVAYVIWGSGIAQSIPGSGEGTEFGLPVNRRKDIAQADFAPLMSTIISVPVPVNSIGRLPVELLNMTLENKAKAIYSNSRQLTSQFNALRKQVEENSIPLLYYPFKSFKGKNYKEFIHKSKKLLNEKKFKELITLSKEIMNLSLAGLMYYHNYYCNILLAFISLSFLGWIALLITLLLEKKETDKIEIQMDNDKSLKMYIWHAKSKKLNLIFASVSIILTILISIQRLPNQYILYSLVPVLLWWRVFSSADVWVKMFKQNRILNILTLIIQYSMGTVALVYSFSHRWFLCVPLFGMLLWPFVSMKNKRISRKLLFCWVISCVLLGVFSFFPVVSTQIHIPLVIIAGTIGEIVSIWFHTKILRKLQHSGREKSKEVTVSGFQTVLLMFAMYNVYTQNKRFEEGTSVIIGHQALAWIIAGISMFTPLYSSTRQAIRLFAINLSLLTFYLLLSVSHEALFLVTLMINLACWLVLEFNLSNHKETELLEYRFNSSSNNQQRQPNLLRVRSVNEQDLRRSFFFLLYIILSFSGTGNIASLNLLRVRWVTCFVTKLRPFLITPLILCKTIVPFLAVTCIFRAISVNTNASTGYLIVMVLIFSDAMGLQFLYCVKNTGSWMEIGTSISHYVIANMITAFIILMYFVSKILTEIDVYNMTWWRRDQCGGLKSNITLISVPLSPVSASGGSKRKLTLPEAMGYTIVQCAVLSKSIEAEEETLS